MINLKKYKMSLKSKISAFIKKLWNSIEKAWNKLDIKVKVLIPVAIQVTNAIKEIVQDGSFTGEIIEVVLSKIKLNGNIDEKILSLVRFWLPQVLTKLVIVQSISEQSTTEDQITAIIDTVRLYNNDQKEIFWDALAKKLVECFADGELTKNEIAYLVKWVYDNKIVYLD